MGRVWVIIACARLRIIRCCNRELSDSSSVLILYFKCLLVVIHFEALRLPVEVYVDL